MMSGTREEEGTEVEDEDSDDSGSPPEEPASIATAATISSNPVSPSSTVRCISDTRTLTSSINLDAPSLQPVEEEKVTGVVTDLLRRGGEERDDIRGEPAG